MNQSNTTTLNPASNDVRAQTWQTEDKFQHVLTHLGQQALSGLSLIELFQLTANLIGDVLNVDYSNVWQILSDRHSLQRVASYSLAKDVPHPEICLLQDDTVETTLNDNQPILLNLNNLSSPVNNNNNFCLPIPPDVVSGVQVPIPGTSKYLGIIEVHTISPREFSPDTIHFLQSVTHILSTAIERQQAEGLAQSQRQVLEEVATGNNLQEIFNSLCLLMEHLLPGSYCSILIVDPDQQCLKSGAAPTLPADYAAGVDGLMIGQCAGSCGTAAYRGQSVFVTDIANDPLWAAFRDFALGHNIRACWSTPFFSKTKEVLGTFAISHQAPCQPTQYHRDVLNTAAHLASIATESYRAAEALKNANQELERKVAERTVDLQQALEKLKKTQAQLVHTEKMSSLGQMVAGIAHEINNPVGFIVGNLDYAENYVQQLIDVITTCQKQSSALPPSITEHIQEIDFDFIAKDLPKLITSMQSGGERIANIVLGLRNFSRLDEAEQKTVNIHDGLNNTLMLLNHRLVDQGNQSRIEVIKDYGNVSDILCYPNQLNQVFMNLLSNAIDAVDIHNDENPGRNPDEGCSIDSHSMEREDSNHTPQIRIQTRIPEPDRVQILIQDNGCGIDESIQSRIFDPFFTTKLVGAGTGLGLSISYQIITERHGGVLQCESTPGQGSTFVIELPTTSPEHT